MWVISITNAHLFAALLRIGYMLLRGMIEDDLRKKQEQEQQVVAARDAARKMASMMPLLALLQMAESSRSPAKQVTEAVRVCLSVIETHLQTSHA